MVECAAQVNLQEIFNALEAEHGYLTVYAGMKAYISANKSKLHNLHRHKPLIASGSVRFLNGVYPVEVVKLVYSVENAYYYEVKALVLTKIDCRKIVYKKDERLVCRNTCLHSKQRKFPKLVNGYRMEAYEYGLALQQKQGSF